MCYQLPSLFPPSSYPLLRSHTLALSLTLISPLPLLPAALPFPPYPITYPYISLLSLSLHHFPFLQHPSLFAPFPFILPSYSLILSLSFSLHHFPSSQPSSLFQLFSFILLTLSLSPSLSLTFLYFSSFFLTCFTVSPLPLTLSRPSLSASLPHLLKLHPLPSSHRRQQPEVLYWLSDNALRDVLLHAARMLLLLEWGVQHLLPQTGLLVK